VTDTQAAETLQTVLCPSPLVRRRATILVVEDEALVREMTSEILESEGYQVLKARNALEALEIFRRYCRIVDVLLTDIVLPPGQNGRDLSNELRKISPGLLTIFSSGYPLNAVNRQGIHDDSNLYLPKPFSAQSLLQKVSQALEGR
jgi:two-component system, cell cycle sensor histidine kinase and response regulator CckA